MQRYAQLFEMVRYGFYLLIRKSSALLKLVEMTMGAMIRVKVMTVVVLMQGLSVEVAFYLVTKFSSEVSLEWDMLPLVGVIVAGVDVPVIGGTLAALVVVHIIGGFIEAVRVLARMIMEWADIDDYR